MPNLLFRNYNPQTASPVTAEEILKRGKNKSKVLEKDLDKDSAHTDLFQFEKDVSNASANLLDKYEQLANNLSLNNDKNIIRPLTQREIELIPEYENFLLSISSSRGKTNDKLKELIIERRKELEKK